ncbi:UvrD-helicase domain-containing protein [Pseudomonas salomonii]|uniref:DNA helicase-2 / ATP-dependent DNA helicase PcrA n=1 Tax=Pseudomonas salomonii TaxID=191391 RepID=A0A1H3KCP3_9PSED|nr:UvrD-helicase domain-containing protein [Pseudomonas salomonii]SDY49903.1 DNA helicase-2 / ATP-dependent DNA helicase PcrA [Pseudomonas salomonii]
MDIKITPFNQVLSCLESETSFLLQGGAGSGKTETLKKLLDHLSRSMPDKKVACITHTNLAANEIKARAGDLHSISTIHSFLNGIIKSYKLDIHKIIHEIFQLDEFVAGEAMEDEKEYKKLEHDRYKKKYEKYADKAYFILGYKEDKVLGKRDYDNKSSTANEALNEKIRHLNGEIKDAINRVPSHKITYNETAFDSLRELSFGHDGLIKVAVSLFRKYPKLRKILSDKYDYIFVDEYQDTSPDVVKVFLDYVAAGTDVTFGFFGDSMQGIYEDGIGDVDAYVLSGALHKINKEDNFRCSEQVIKFINKLRDDGLEQKVALKKMDGGESESLESRQGRVKLFCAVHTDKPHSSSSSEQKEAYQNKLYRLIEKTQASVDYKTLMLTNKAIASKAGFGRLYEIFNSRFGQSTNENLEKILSACHFLDLYNLYEAFASNEHWKVIEQVKKSGFLIDSVNDKEILLRSLSSIFDLTVPIHDLTRRAFELKLIKRSEAYDRFIKRKDLFLEQLEGSHRYREFKEAFIGGLNTHSRLSKSGFEIDEYEFRDLERDCKREIFYTNYFGFDLTLKDVICYYDYLGEKTNYITMHKTKGSGIQNVLVVVDEFFWRDYNFKNIFSSKDILSENRKIIYVACSRAIENLICVKLVDEVELSTVSDFFEDVEVLEFD